MTRRTVAQGQRPSATVHPVIHSTMGVIVLTVAQQCMKWLFYYSEHTKGKNMKYQLRDADARTVHLCPYGSGQAIQDPKAL